ncbi:hypothetical protein KC946_02070 [Candidatus Saccharibacteria bacterium]|nr:hypothetical protein [Candidatus Saccharibacteria bacterium]
MTKFMLLYKGPATPMENISEENGKEIMDGWRRWMEKVGDALTDIGSPLAPGKAQVDDGKVREAIDLSGYTIIQAENIDKALELVKDHPFLSDKTGEFSVEIFEITPLPDMSA